MEKLSISKIWARGFRSLDDFSLDLGPLTVLVGRNGSGKSNIVDILSFISDAFYLGVPTALNLRGGPSELLNASAGQMASQFTVGLRATNNLFTAEYELTVQVLSRNRISVREERIWLQIEDRVSETVVNNGNINKPSLDPTMRRMLNRIRNKVVARAKDRGGVGPVYTPMLSLIGDQPALAGLITSWLFPLDSPKDNEEIANAILDFSFMLGEMRFYRIFPDDIRVPQLHSVTDVLEENGSNFASVLRDLRRRDRRSADRIDHALGRVVPGVSRVTIRGVGGAQIVSFDHFAPENPEKTWKLGISQESDGTVRALGLLVALNQHPFPSLITIDEPELGIHAGALRIFAELLEYSSESSQVIVTTHSSDLLDFLAIESLESIKVVVMTNGTTFAGPVASHQIAAIQEDLFTAGNINRIQGLELD